MELSKFCEVIFEDNHLLVVNKLQNVLVQEDSTGDPDLLSALKAYIKKKYNKPGNVFLGLVHRLDRPVGGVMVFARTSKAAARLSEQIREHQFQKRYLVVVEGIPEKKTATLKHYLQKDVRMNKTSVYASPVPGSKESLLRYETLDTQDGVTLLRVVLLTGRGHQIRAQLAAAGTPILGDVKYNMQKQRRVAGIALFASELGFVHPTTKEHLTFSAQPQALYPWTLFPDTARGKA